MVLASGSVGGGGGVAVPTGKVAPAEGFKGGCVGLRGAMGAVVVGVMVGVVGGSVV